VVPRAYVRMYACVLVLVPLNSNIHRYTSSTIYTYTRQKVTMPVAVALYARREQLAPCDPSSFTKQRLPVKALTPLTRWPHNKPLAASAGFGRRESLC